ncbi:MAG: LPXTG cell wall anchor domain-containing protein [Coprobacillaceae bacterium]
MIKKISALAISAVVIISMFFSSNVYASNMDIWDGSEDKSWYDTTNPKSKYQLTTAEELAGLARLVHDDVDFNGVTFELMNDIDLNNIDWMPIGGSIDGEILSGVTFEGNGHVIYNMKQSSTGWFGGFFGWIEQCQIQNLGIENVDINTTGCEVGDLVGSMIDSSIYRCYTTGNINVSGDPNIDIGDAIDGLVGQYYCETDTVSAMISESYSSVNITATIPGQYGGLIAWVSTYNNSTFTIRDCYYSGDLLVSDGESQTGGIVGLAATIVGFGFPDLPSGEYTIENCYVSGSVKNTGDVSFSTGIALIDGVVDNCYWRNDLHIEGVSQSKWDKNTGSFIPGDNSLTTNSEAKAIEEMKANNFMETLNNNRTIPVWGLLRNNERELFPVLGWQLKFHLADYSEVDKAIAQKPVDLTLYTEESITNLDNAINSVVVGKTADEQSIVDGYAQIIIEAIEQLDYKEADYTLVDAALARIPSDLSIYTEASVNSLIKARDSVVRNKKIIEQETVNNYANQINKAVDSLIKKNTNTSTSLSPKTGDETNVTILYAGIIISISGILIMIKRKSR